MGIFKESVSDFLSERGFHGQNEVSCRLSASKGVETLCISSGDGFPPKYIFLLSPVAETPEEAAEVSDSAWESISKFIKTEGVMPLVISEDRWNSDRKTIQARILAHLEIFFPIYARNCEVRKIDKETAARFLERTHSYGDASCRHRYGLFLKRHTGHIAAELSTIEDSIHNDLQPGCLIAVATFSNARKWKKGDKIIRSYEWTRYASLPGVRVNGGMGKLLKTFIEDISPDDIMSYADLEWSEGKVYEKLGFKLEDYKAPVCFRIDTQTWRRQVYREETDPGNDTIHFFRNFGSAKYRLKLTEYE